MVGGGRLWRAIAPALARKALEQREQLCRPLNVDCVAAARHQRHLSSGSTSRALVVPGWRQRGCQPFSHPNKFAIILTSNQQQRWQGARRRGRLQLQPDTGGAARGGRRQHRRQLLRIPAALPLLQQGLEAGAGPQRRPHGQLIPVAHKALQASLPQGTCQGIVAAGPLRPGSWVGQPGGSCSKQGRRRRGR